MSDYPMTWITQNIAVGPAPMSYDDLDSIKKQGVVGIVNLCGEFSDLHLLEEQAGFEVFWIPIPDETAPTMAEMEKGLEWLDEATYLGKKVLIHCHHGIGRTGTFITAYLLRRGFGMKKASKLLKSTRANPTNYSQWWLLRKFGKKEGLLTRSKPTPDNRKKSSLDDFYRRYELLLEKVDSLADTEGSEEPFSCCTEETAAQCGMSFSLELIEALYLHDKMNITLTAEKRKEVIERASKRRKELFDNKEKIADASDLPDTSAAGVLSCPLEEAGRCLLYQFRPIHCRLRRKQIDPTFVNEMKKELSLLSSEVFESLFGLKIDETPPLINSLDSVSGKFIQSYFQYMTQRKG